jgi:hypothetical protein
VKLVLVLLKLWKHVLLFLFFFFLKNEACVTVGWEEKILSERVTCSS